MLSLEVTTYWTAIIQQTISCLTTNMSETWLKNIWKWTYLSKQWRWDKAGEGQRKSMHSSTLTTAPVDTIVVRGWDAGSTEQRRPEYQQQPSYLGGWHTLRLGPGSGAEKWGKETAVFQSPLASNKDSTVWESPNHPSVARQAARSLSRSWKGWKNLSSLSSLYSLQLTPQGKAEPQMCKLTLFPAHPS